MMNLVAFRPIRVPMQQRDMISPYLCQIVPKCGGLVSNSVHNLLLPQSIQAFQPSAPAFVNIQGLKSTPDAAEMSHQRTFQPTA